MGDWYLTGYGRTFFERDIPKIAKSLESISKSLEEINKNLAEIDTTLVSTIKDKK